MKPARWLHFVLMVGSSFFYLLPATSGAGPTQSHVAIPRTQLPAENLEAVFRRQLQRAYGEAVIRNRLAARDDLLKLAEALEAGDFPRLRALLQKWKTRSETLGLDDPRLRELARKHLREREQMEMAGKYGTWEGQPEKLAELLRKLAGDLERGSEPGWTNLHRPFASQPPALDPNWTPPRTPSPSPDIPLSPDHRQLLDSLRSNPGFESTFRNLLESSMAWQANRSTDAPWLSSFHANLMPWITDLLGSASFSLPLFDRAFSGPLKFPIALDWGLPSVGGSVDITLPDVGLSDISPSSAEGNIVWPVFLVLAAVVVLVLVLRRQPRLGWHASGSKNRRWQLGAWPVSPTAVRLRAELISAFEYLAMLQFGPEACLWTHHTIADRLGHARSTASAERRKAARRLAAIYEQARYAPPDEPIAEADLAAARRDLCLLAGVALS